MRVAEPCGAGSQLMPGLGGRSRIPVQSDELRRERPTREDEGAAVAREVEGEADRFAERQHPCGGAGESATPSVDANANKLDVGTDTGDDCVQRIAARIPAQRPSVAEDETVDHAVVGRREQQALLQPERDPPAIGRWEQSLKLAEGGCERRAVERLTGGRANAPDESRRSWTGNGGEENRVPGRGERDECTGAESPRGAAEPRHHVRPGLA